jgi:hypothetical protein
MKGISLRSGRHLSTFDSHRDIPWRILSASFLLLLTGICYSGELTLVRTLYSQFSTFCGTPAISNSHSYYNALVHAEYFRTVNHTDKTSNKSE